MIRKVRVKNYKSIPDLHLELGRLTVLIGANGSGKSNILEAITLASAAAQNKLDNEFLISRGIRVTDTRFMRCAFDNDQATSGIDGKITISIEGDNDLAYTCELSADETGSYPKWTQNVAFVASELLALLTANDTVNSEPKLTHKKLEHLFTADQKIADTLFSIFKLSAGTLPGFLIYAPENSALRTFQAEGQILPLGIRGEGLFAHLKALNTGANRDRLVKIKECLSLIDWYESFDIPEDLSSGERTIRIKDRYLADQASFDQRSANEGFLFLLFYITLMISPDTPAFFSIDNIDSAFNPKLCVALLQQIVRLAKEYNKQIILTTHNPAVLDGLNLHDTDQRLLTVDRNKAGHTRVRRVDPPQAVYGQPVVSSA